ncbi:MAG: hypothetical protein WB615_07645 [Candidatus Tumulicola sp.]
MKRSFSIPQFVVYLAGFLVAGGLLLGTKPSTPAILATFGVIAVLTIIYAQMQTTADRKALDSSEDGEGSRAETHRRPR